MWEWEWDMEIKCVSLTYAKFNLHCNSNGHKTEYQLNRQMMDVIIKACLYHSNFRILLLFMLVKFATLNRIFFTCSIWSPKPVGISKKIMKRYSYFHFNPISTNVPLLYLLKTLENLWFSLMYSRGIEVVH